MFGWKALVSVFETKAGKQARLDRQARVDIERSGNPMLAWINARKGDLSQDKLDRFMNAYASKDEVGVAYACMLLDIIPMDLERGMDKTDPASAPIMNASIILENNIRSRGMVNGRLVHFFTEERQKHSILAGTKISAAAASLTHENYFQTILKQHSAEFPMPQRFEIAEEVMVYAEDVLRRHEDRLEAKAFNLNTPIAFRVFDEIAHEEFMFWRHRNPDTKKFLRAWANACYSRQGALVRRPALTQSDTYAVFTP